MSEAYRRGLLDSCYVMERWAASLGIPEVPVKAIIRRRSTPIPLTGTTCREPGNVGEDVAKRSRRSALAGHSPPHRCGEQAAAPSEINRVAQDPAVLGGNREVKHKVVVLGGEWGGRPEIPKCSWERNRAGEMRGTREVRVMSQRSAVPEGRQAHFKKCSIE